MFSEYFSAENSLLGTRAFRVVITASQQLGCQQAAIWLRHPSFFSQVLRWEVPYAGHGSLQYFKDHWHAGPTPHGK